MQDAPRWQEGKWALIKEDAPDASEKHWRWHWPVDCREMIARGGWVIVPGYGPAAEDKAPVLKENLPYYSTDEGERPEDGAPPEVVPEPVTEEAPEPEKKAPKPRKRRAPRKSRKPKAGE